MLSELLSYINSFSPIYFFYFYCIFFYYHLPLLCPPPPAITMAMSLSSMSMKGNRTRALVTLPVVFLLLRLMCHFPRTGNVDLTLRIATQSPQPFDLREAFPSRRSFSRLFVSLRTPAKPDITPLTFKIPHYTFYWNPNNPPQATSVFSAP